MGIRKSKKLIDIVKNKQKVDFTYTNLKGETERRSGVEIHTLGYDKKGHSAIRAYEPGVGWRLFHNSSIKDFKPTGKDYKKTRPGYNNRHDRGMKSIVQNTTKTYKRKK